MDLSFYLIVMAFAALMPLPSGFALGYLGSERRTRDGLLLAAFSAAFAAGATLSWFGMKIDPPAESMVWFIAAGFLIGGFGLGALGGLAARAFGVLGWIIGVFAALAGLACEATVIFAFVFADVKPF